MSGRANNRSECASRAGDNKARDFEHGFQTPALLGESRAGLSASRRACALPVADLPQPPRSLRVLCLWARRPLLLVKEVSPAHIRNVWRGGKPHKGFCALLRAE
jgi:hypothetical protein